MNNGTSIRIKGMSRTSFYRVWTNLRQRCANPNHRLYKWYGARGISFCPSWVSFDNFYLDMFDSYSSNLVLDRIDNDKGYSKENCRWVSQKLNCRNKRGNKIIQTPAGAITLAEASEIYNISRDLLSYRLSHGYSDTEAITKPVRTGNYGRQRSAA
jgi:hypothetical protein